MKKTGYKYGLILFLLLGVLLTGFGRRALAAAPSVTDEADIISAGHETVLAEKIAALEQKYQTRIMILTVTSMQRSDLSGGKVYYDIQAFTGDYYDYIAAEGKEQSGVILCVNMEPDNREFCIVATGREKERFQRHMEYIYDRIYEDLRRTEYNKAMDTYLSLIETKLRLGFYPPGAAKILISVGVGLLVGWLIVRGMQGRMNNVHTATSASSYLVPGSFHLRRQQEVFLYSHVTQTARQTQRKGGGGGGGFHIGSSGISHGGLGGRKF